MKFYIFVYIKMSRCKMKTKKKLYLVICIVLKCAPFRFYCLFFFYHFLERGVIIIYITFLSEPKWGQQLNSDNNDKSSYLKFRQKLDVSLFFLRGLLETNNGRIYIISWKTTDTLLRLSILFGFSCVCTCVFFSRHNLCKSCLNVQCIRTLSTIILAII